MKAILRSGFLALAIMLALAVPVVAGPYEDGVAAYERGDHVRALEIWRPLAEQGDAKALISFGDMSRLPAIDNFLTFRGDPTFVSE